MSSDPADGGALLVVEDDPAVREEWAAALRRVGYAVTTAADGRQALALLREGLTPPLIVLDMLTPEVDGWHFLERKRHDPALAAVPVVITTGLGVASSEWAASLGAAGYLRKPVEIDDLLREVGRCLGGGRPTGPG